MVKHTDRPQLTTEKEQQMFVLGLITAGRLNNFIYEPVPTTSDTNVEQKPKVITQTRIEKGEGYE